MRELLEAGVHRLAQPLTTALWIAEIPPDDGSSGPLFGSLAHELQRAVGVLQALRMVLEARQADSTVADLADAVRPVAALALEEFAALGVICECALPDGKAGVDAPLAATQNAIEECFLALKNFASPGTRLSLRLHDTDCESRSGVVTVRLTSPDGRTFSEAEQKQFAGSVDPFDTPGFNFVDFRPGAPFVSRIAMATSGVALHARADKQSLQLQIVTAAKGHVIHEVNLF